MGRTKKSVRAKQCVSFMAAGQKHGKKSSKSKTKASRPRKAMRMKAGNAMKPHRSSTAVTAAANLPMSLLGNTMT